MIWAAPDVSDAACADRPTIYLASMETHVDALS